MKPKKLVNRHPRRQNKSFSKCLDDLLSSVQKEATGAPEKDEWLERTTGSYKTGKKNVLTLFRNV
jgi:hypothetical protein